MERELLLLGLLRRQEMHGYQLYEFIERELASCTDMKKPTAYFLLNKMVQDGWITEEQMQEGHRPPRRVFRLTSSGEAEYQRLLRANLASYSPTYFTGDIGIAFMDDLDPTEALALLESRRAELMTDLQTIHSVPEHPGASQWVVKHQARHLSAELEWLDEIRSHLKGKTLEKEFDRLS